MPKSFNPVCTYLVQHSYTSAMHFLQQPGLRMTFGLLLSQGLCEPLYTCSSPWHRPQPGGWHNQPWRAQPPGRECPALFGEVTITHNVYNTSDLQAADYNSSLLSSQCCSLGCTELAIMHFEESAEMLSYCCIRCWVAKNLMVIAVLGVQIENQAYPVNVEALHTVFTPYGFVQKIACFEKNNTWQVKSNLTVFQTWIWYTNAIEAVGHNCCRWCSEINEATRL